MLTQQRNVEAANEYDAEGRHQRRGQVNAQFTIREDHQGKVLGSVGEACAAVYTVHATCL